MYKRNQCLNYKLLFIQTAVLLLQLFSRLLTTKEKFQIPVCDGLTLSQGDVLEFDGTDDVGKYELLLSVAAHCILPKSSLGCERGVLFISIEHKFSIIKLVQLLEQKLKMSTSDLEHKHLLINRKVIESILERFQLFHCESVSDCCMALMSFLHFPSTYSNIGAVVIDVGTFWGEHGKLGGVIDILNKIMQEFKLIVILSSFSLSNDWNYFKPWSKLVKYRFKLVTSTEGMQTYTTIQQIYPESGKSYKFTSH